MQCGTIFNLKALPKFIVFCYDGVCITDLLQKLESLVAAARRRHVNVDLLLPARALRIDQGEDLVDRLLLAHVPIKVRGEHFVFLCRS